MEAGSRDDTVWAALGPFYAADRVAHWRGVSREALDEEVACHRLLGLTAGGGQRFHPGWQFTDDGRLVPGLEPVLAVLLDATDPWTAAVWLTTNSERLDGLSAIDWLQASRDPQRVMDVATGDAFRWEV